jgi:hypothetical protein
LVQCAKHTNAKTVAVNHLAIDLEAATIENLKFSPLQIPWGFCCEQESEHFAEPNASFHAITGQGRTDRKTRGHNDSQSMRKTHSRLKPQALIVHDRARNFANIS